METINFVQKNSGKSKSTHDVLDDPKLSKETQVFVKTGDYLFKEKLNFYFFLTFIQFLCFAEKELSDSEMNSDRLEQKNAEIKEKIKNKLKSFKDSAKDGTSKGDKKNASEEVVVKVSDSDSDYETELVKEHRLNRKRKA